MARDLRGLNWGCGPNVVKGWWNSDVVDYGQEHVGSILDGLPCRDSFFDGVVANHSLQCLTAAELDAAMAELARVLRPGGRLRVLVPDVFAAISALEYQEDDWPGFVAISEPWDLDRKACHYLTWGGQNRTVFSPDTLVGLMARHGLTSSVRWWADAANRELDHDWTWLSALDTRLGESIVMEFVK